MFMFIFISFLTHRKRERANVRRMDSTRDKRCIVCFITPTWTTGYS